MQEFLGETPFFAYLTCHKATEHRSDWNQQSGRKNSNKEQTSSQILAWFESLVPGKQLYPARDGRDSWTPILVSAHPAWGKCLSRREMPVNCLPNGNARNHQVLGANAIKVAGLIWNKLILPLKGVVLLFPYPGYLLLSPVLYMESSALQIRKLTQLKTNPTEKKNQLEVSSILVAPHFCLAAVFF